jgi:spheroidene monooxygenase
MNIEGTQAVTTPLAGVVVIVLLDYLRQHQAWGWFRLASGPPHVKAHPGLLFAKIMGSGHGGGFTLRPSASHQGVMAVFDHVDHAQQFLQSTYVQESRSRARESWVGLMAVDSVRGQWDGCEWGVTPSDPQMTSQGLTLTAHPERMAVLTRASIRPAKAMAFWRHAPAAQADLNQAQGCEIAMGLGEAPLVRQCTFSLWHSKADMLHYAHDGAHRSAIEAANRYGFFNESLFVRMQLLAMQGRWRDQDLNHQAEWLELAHG